MKQFDKDNYRRHLMDLKEIDTEDTYKVETYLRGSFDIANGFNQEEKASGILSRNDLIQECYTALVEAWENINWEVINKSDNPRGQIWSFLKKSIQLKARERIHNTKDGIRIPHAKRWEINETKNVDDFLSQLFPTEWFSENDETLDLIDYGYNTRYDVEQLGLAFEDVFRSKLSDKETFVIANSFGIGCDKLPSKDIANRLGITVSNVNKTKFVAIQKLKNEEVREYLQNFYYFK